MKKTLVGILVTMMLLVGCKENMDPSIGQFSIQYFDILPQDEPILFMPNIVSTQHFEHSSPTFVNEQTILWSRFDQPLSPDKPHNIMMTKFTDVWSSPQVVDWSHDKSEDSPFFYDGKVYYHRTSDSRSQIYYYDLKDKIEKKVDIKSDNSLAWPSVTKDSIVYAELLSEAPETMMMIYDKESGEAKPLLSNDENEYMNVTPFMSDDESILLYGSPLRLGGKGASDLYVAFKLNDGSWSEGINLEKINTKANERFPSLSPDGKYLFFVSNRRLADNVGSETLPQNGLGDVYWVRADFLYSLKADYFSKNNQQDYVTIDGLNWSTSNLHVDEILDDDDFVYYLQDQPYGNLYPKETLLAYQMFLPEGWRMPTESEWDTLIQSKSINELISDDDFHTNEDSLLGLNASGMYDFTGVYQWQGESFVYAALTDDKKDIVYYYYDVEKNTIKKGNFHPKDGVSVRLIYEAAK